jgi:hypothetical protein
MIWKKIEYTRLLQSFQPLVITGLTRAGKVNHGTLNEAKNQTHQSL